MIEQKDILCTALKQCAWGYIFLYFNINIVTVNLLPSWVGYFLFYHAIKIGISQYETSSNLLKPLAVFLGIYHGILWILGIFDVATNFYIINDIISVLTLYFQFQLLTNLSNIAGKYRCTHQKSLLTLRNIQTILTTATLFLVHTDWYGVILFMVVVQVIVAICIYIELRSLRISLEQMPEDKWMIYTNILEAEI